MIFTVILQPFWWYLLTLFGYEVQIISYFVVPIGALILLLTYTLILLMFFISFYMLSRFERENFTNFDEELDKQQGQDFLDNDNKIVLRECLNAFKEEIVRLDEKQQTNMKNFISNINDTIVTTHKDIQKEVSLFGENKKPQEIVLVDPEEKNKIVTPPSEPKNSEPWEKLVNMYNNTVLAGPQDINEFQKHFPKVVVFGLPKDKRTARKYDITNFEKMDFENGSIYAVWWEDDSEKLLFLPKAEFVINNETDENFRSRGLHKFYEYKDGWPREVPTIKKPAIGTYIDNKIKLFNNGELK